MTKTSAPSFMPEFLAIHPSACPACGYALPADTVDRCSNCAAALGLGLVSREGYRAAWGILLTILLIDAGLGLLFAVILLRAGLGGLKEDLRLPFLLFISSIPLPVFMIILRRSFLRRSNPFQWFLTILGLTLSAVVFALFILALR